MRGQLGHGTSYSELSPRALNVEKNRQKLKVVQIGAGYEHSVLLLENRELVWFGTNGAI